MSHRTSMYVSTILFVFLLFPQLSLSQFAFLIDYFTGDLVKLELADPSNATVIGTTEQFLADAEFGAGNVLYALPFGETEFFQIDTTDASVTQIGNSIPITDHMWSGLAWDTTTNQLFAVSIDGISSIALYTINTLNGDATLVCSTDEIDSVADISFDEDGQLYGHNLQDTFYAIDKTDCSMVYIGETGFQATGPWHGMDFSHADGTMYMATYNGINFVRTLRSVSLRDGMTTEIGEINYNSGGFAITHPEMGYQPGDVNMDGSVDVTDIVAMVNFILGAGDLNDQQFELADINSNGLVNVEDLVLVVQIILGN